MDEAHFFFGTVVKTINDMKIALSILEYDINDAADTYDLESSLESFFEYEAKFHHIINFINSELKLYNTGDGDEKNNNTYKSLFKMIKSKKSEIDKLLNALDNGNTNIDNEILHRKGIMSIKEAFYAGKRDQGTIKLSAEI